MNFFTRAVSQSFQGALKAFGRFPAAIACALVFAAVTLAEIQLDTAEYNFLFSCLRWALGFGAVFSMAGVVLAHSRFESQKTFYAANLLAALAAAALFLLLYFFSGRDLGTVTVVSELARARVIAAIVVSAFAFVVLAASPKAQSDFARSFFMTHKAFFIALIYALVMWAGTAGVAAAVESLLYHDMSPKVYSYLATVSGLIAFTLFLGYFPDFRKGQNDEHRITAQKQPRFIEILFGYIMVPLVLALTLVLLIWATKTALSGMNASFNQLAEIAAAYTLGGLWLHIMVTHHETALAKWYRLIYPIAALVILVFEAWALVLQLQDFGLKSTEYFFILLWLFAAVSALLLLIMKSKAHPAMIVLFCALAVVAVLPFVGYQPLSVTMQANRLEKILAGEDMLQNNAVTAAAKTPDEDVRIKITDAVYYLAGVDGAKLPAWFNPDFDDAAVFKKSFGFDPAWPQNGPGDAGDTFRISAWLPSSALDISAYRWAVNFSGMDMYGEKTVTVEGEKGIYKIYWTVDANTGIPTVKVVLAGDVIYDQDLGAYLGQMEEKYPAKQGSSGEAKAEDMYLPVVTDDIKMLLVFDYLDGYTDSKTTYYNVTLNTLYFNENQ